MPLDDREQKILADIERQFYEEDPGLARAVKGIERRSSRAKIRLAALGVVVGLATILFFFATNIIIALVGFAVLLASATVLAPEIKKWVTPPAVELEDSDTEI
jgi:Protein of unknown function (DUF3040)